MRILATSVRAAHLTGILVALDGRIKTPLHSHQQRRGDQRWDVLCRLHCNPSAQAPCSCPPLGCMKMQVALPPVQPSLITSTVPHYELTRQQALLLTAPVDALGLVHPTGTVTCKPTCSLFRRWATMSGNRSSSGGCTPAARSVRTTSSTSTASLDAAPKQNTSCESLLALLTGSKYNLENGPTVIAPLRPSCRHILVEFYFCWHIFFLEKCF